MSTICQKCGMKYTVDVNVPNWLWSNINYKGRKDSYNLLCPKCIGMGLILYHACQGSRGKYAAYELLEIPRQYNNEENSNSAEKAQPGGETNKAMPKCCPCHSCGKSCAFFPLKNVCGNSPCVALRHS